MASDRCHAVLVPRRAALPAGGFMVQDGIVVVMRNAVLPDGIVI